MRWQLGQFVPIRFKHIESDLIWQWPGKSLQLYLYMRRFVWRSREGALGQYYARGYLVMSGYLGTWANASGASKASVSRWLAWMRKQGIVTCLVDSQKTGGNSPNIYALGQVYDVPGGDDQDAIELFYLDFAQATPTTRAMDIPDLADLQHEIEDPDIILIPRGPVAKMEQGVAKMEQGVAKMKQGVAPVQPYNREEIEKGIESKSGAAPLSPEGEADDAWLQKSRIVEPEEPHDLTAEEQAKVASPVAEAPPEDPTLPEWERMMRKSLKGHPLTGDFTADDVVAYCQRFYDLTSNPPPAHHKGNTNWRSGAQATLEAFHGSLFTLYETHGQSMPEPERQRRVFGLCVDLFFTPGAGYDHIKAPTPRSLANSMPGLIGDLVEICNMFDLNGTMPDKTHIKTWITERQKGGKRGKKERRSGPASANATIRSTCPKSDEAEARDRDLARKLIADRT